MVDLYEKNKTVWEYWETLRKTWQEEADASPTMYQWLKENIHKNER